MSLRFRGPVALLVLVAMTLAAAEAVRAAPCDPELMQHDGAAMADMPMGDMPMGDMSMDDMSMGDMSMADMAMDMPMTGAPADGGHSHGSPRNGRDAPVPECPFAPAGGAQGCSSIALLPSERMTLSIATLESAALPSSFQMQHGLLDAASVFHPPRA